MRVVSSRHSSSVSWQPSCCPECSGTAASIAVNRTERGEQVIEKVVYLNDKAEFTPPPGFEYDTNYNVMPGPYWEVDPAEYINYGGGFRFREYRQVRLPGVAEHLVAISIEWHADRGYA